MAEEQADRVILDLIPGEPISGWISAGVGPTEAFRGWIELASKLEHLRKGRGSPGSDLRD